MHAAVASQCYIVTSKAQLSTDGVHAAVVKAMSSSQAEVEVGPDHVFIVVSVPEACGVHDGWLYCSD